MTFNIQKLDFFEPFSKVIDSLATTPPFSKSQAFRNTCLYYHDILIASISNNGVFLYVPKGLSLISNDFQCFFNLNNPAHHSISFTRSSDLRNRFKFISDDVCIFKDCINDLVCILDLMPQSQRKGILNLNDDLVLSDDLKFLPNIDNKIHRKLTSIGIRTKSDLDQMGSVRAFIRLTKQGGSIGKSTLIKLQGAIDRRHYLTYSKAERDKLDQSLLTHKIEHSHTF